MSRKTIPRETEKPKKLTRAQKKEIDAVLRKYKGDGKPRTAQATIPYEAIYPDGVCRIDRRTFSKCIAFEDISYQLAQPETRTAIFEHLCDLYNYVDASIHVQLSFLNRKVDPVQYAKSFEIAPQGDDFDDIRAEYTAILQKQLASGNNGIVKTKYLTFTIEADSLKTARARLTRIGLDLLGYFKTMGCVAHVMDGQERLEVLHGIFHPDGEPFRFDWDWLAPSGLSTKDFVAPSSLCFGTAKTFGLGGKYGAVSFLQILAPELSDEMLADFLKTESGILVNLHVQAIDQTEAIKTIKRKITDLDAMKIQEQKKAVRSGYDMDILPSDLATYGEDAKKLLNKLQTRNERLFMLTFLVLNVADTKQKLGNDVFQAAGVAQKYNCSLVRLDYQQEQGLVSSLPLGINQIKIQRSLTTSNVAVFGLLALLLITGLQSCTVMAGTAGTGVTASSYFSKDKDMLGAEKAYAKLEQKLQRYLDTYEATHNYDEYHFYLDEIEHDPYVLISILSALHDGVFTLAEVQGELEMLFEKQYILTETVTMQIRYRTKMMVIIGPYGVPQVITYQEPYEYYICTVKLKNKDLSHLPVEVLTEEQLSAYSLYMRTLGNRPDLFGKAQYPNASTIKQPTYYDIPPEALKDDRFAAMMEEATKYIGYPYVWGGSSPSTSFDCSGYISWVLNHSGWNVGRQTAQGLYNLCTPVSTAQVKPGDLVFFKGTYDTPGVSHCGIYVGNSIMLHCGDPISYTNLNSKYWQEHFYSYGRLP